MSDVQTFWTVECEPGDPDFFVCMVCLNEVFYSKVPIQGCPGCGAVSAFEAFSLESIKEWGTEDLINKAQEIGSSMTIPHSSPDPTVSVEDPLSA